MADFLDPGRPADHEQLLQVPVDGNHPHRRVGDDREEADHEGDRHDARQALAKPEDEDRGEDDHRRHLQDQDVGIERLLQPKGEGHDSRKQEAPQNRGEEAQQGAFAGDQGRQRQRVALAPGRRQDRARAGQHVGSQMEDPDPRIPGGDQRGAGDGGQEAGKAPLHEGSTPRRAWAQAARRSRNSGRLAQGRGSGIGERHGNRGHDPARIRGQDDDAAGKEHRLGDRVGDKEGGERVALANGEQVVVELVAGDFVQGAERLVEEQEARRHAERPGDRSAHAHPAGELPGKQARRGLEAHQGQHPPNALPPPVGGLAPELERQLDIGGDPAPGQEGRVLKHEEQLLAGPLGVPARDADRPLRGRARPAISRSRVDLPQPLGPMKLTNSPASTSRSRPASTAGPAPKRLPTRSRRTRGEADIAGRSLPRARRPVRRASNFRLSAAPDLSGGRHGFGRTPAPAASDFPSRPPPRRPAAMFRSGSTATPSSFRGCSAPAKGR